MASRGPLLSPAPNRRAVEEKRSHTVLPAAKAPPNQPAGREDAAFGPSVISIRRLNIRWVFFLSLFFILFLFFYKPDDTFTMEHVVVFVCSFSEATRDNENKRCVLKTPAHMSSCVTSSTPLTQPASAGKHKTVVFSATKTPGASSLLRRWYQDMQDGWRWFLPPGFHRAVCFQWEQQLGELPQDAEARLWPEGQPVPAPHLQASHRWTFQLGWNGESCNNNNKKQFMYFSFSKVSWSRLERWKRTSQQTGRWFLPAAVRKTTSSIKLKPGLSTLEADPEPPWPRLAHSAGPSVCVCVERTAELNRWRTGSGRRRERLERGGAWSWCEPVETFVQPACKYLSALNSVCCWYFLPSSF